MLQKRSILIMEKTCTKCNNKFFVDQDDQSFYQKMQVPVPQVCPDCRFMMRALFRNETALYSGRNCDMCNKSIITMYNPKLPYTIYCYDCFNGEQWDPRSYATNYDESRPFIEQMKDFLIRVPKISLYLTLGYGENVNSEYVNMASGCKNCYLVFNTGPAEELLYSRGMRKGLDSSDLYFGFSTDRCYESINIQESAGVTHSQNVSSCVDSHFLLNCSGLTNCFGCVNLRNKSNCFLNEQYTADEYKIKVNEIIGSFQKTQEFKKAFETFVLQFPRRANNNLKTFNSTGDYLSECKNVNESYEIFQSEDCKYLFSSKLIKDSMDVIGYGTNCERLLDCVATGFSSNCVGTYGAENSSNLLYGFYVDNCQDCIGCDALKHGKYAIFNKEYTKEEYERLRGIIIKELTDANLYGLMMPPELAPFAYNETIAQDNISLTKEEVLARGFRWEDDIQITKGKETLLPENIPDHIKEVSDSITHEILKCVDCSRNYKITDQEMLFYKKMILPIPRKCFYCRHQARIVRRGSFKFFIRACSHCGIDTHTNLTEEIAPTMYCEKCYQSEVI
jgi:hypothetical protein